MKQRKTKALICPIWKSIFKIWNTFWPSIVYIYLFRQSKVYSYNEKGFTEDIWNFKIQNNLFFIASFTWRDTKTQCSKSYFKIIL